MSKEGYYHKLVSGQKLGRTETKVRSSVLAYETAQKLRSASTTSLASLATSSSRAGEHMNDAGRPCDRNSVMCSDRIERGSSCVGQAHQQ